MTLSLLLSLSAPALAVEGAVSRSLPAGMPALEISGDKGHVTVIYDPNAAESVVTATPVHWGQVGCKLDFSGDTTVAGAKTRRAVPRSRTTPSILCCAASTTCGARRTCTAPTLKVGRCRLTAPRFSWVNPLWAAARATGPTLISCRFLSLGRKSGRALQA